MVPSRRGAEGVAMVRAAAAVAATAPELLLDAVRLVAAGVRRLPLLRASIRCPRIAGWPQR